MHANPLLLVFPVGRLLPIFETRSLAPMVKYECLCLHVRHTHFAPVPDAGRANQSCVTQQNQSNAGVAVGSQHTRVSEKSIVCPRKFPIPQNAQAMSRSGDDCGSERRRRSRMAINDRASRLLLHLVVHAISRSCSACPTNSQAKYSGSESCFDRTR